jgi:hypothetical protein
MNFTHDGLSLWYRTPEAFAPDDDAVMPRKGSALVVGVHPANPTNSVVVRYRVDGGHVQSVAGRELRTDFERQIQYYAVRFPDFPRGETVEYSPLLVCGGRQVPAPHMAERFPSRFRLAAADSPPQRVAQPASTTPLHGAGPSKIRFAPRLDFVATVFVQFDRPQFVGETPTGMRVNFFVREGTAIGDGFRGKVTQGSADHMIVRQDGMGLVRIRSALATEDGATLDMEAGGYVDFGPDGYRRAVAHDLPDRSSLVVTPLIATRHPKYKWLSRIQCVGAGQTHLDADQAFYHVYAAQPRDVPPTR